MAAVKFLTLFTFIVVSTVNAQQTCESGDSLDLPEFSNLAALQKSSYLQIFTQRQFTCSGILTKWDYICLKPNNNPVTVYFSVWRQGQDTRLIEVGSTAVVVNSCTSSGSLETYELLPEQYFSVQAGDVIGMYYGTPNNLESLLVVPYLNASDSVTSSTVVLVQYNALLLAQLSYVNYSGSDVDVSQRREPGFRGYVEDITTTPRQSTTTMLSTTLGLVSTTAAAETTTGVNTTTVKTTTPAPTPTPAPQQATTTGFIQAAVAFADMTINGFPVWAIFAIVGGFVALLVLILLILLCYACSKSSGGRGAKRIPRGRGRTTETQTDYHPDFTPAAMATKATMTKRGQWEAPRGHPHHMMTASQAPQPPPPVNSNGAKPKQKRVVEMHFAGDDSPKMNRRHYY